MAAMQRIVLYLITVLLTFAIGVSADMATNRTIDYLWPDPPLPPFRIVTSHECITAAIQAASRSDRPQLRDE